MNLARWLVDGTVVVSVGGALLFLSEVCGCALLSGRQRSPLPAGRGSHRSDLHLGEVEGHQVALPRLPVHSLAAAQPIERERDRRGKTQSVVRGWGWSEARGNEGDERRMGESQKRQTAVTDRQIGKH